MADGFFGSSLYAAINPDLISRGSTARREAVPRNKTPRQIRLRFIDEGIGRRVGELIIGKPV